jgi:hypothetical protein
MYSTSAAASAAKAEVVTRSRSRGDGAVDWRNDGVAGRNGSKRSIGRKGASLKAGKVR